MFPLTSALIRTSLAKIWKDSARDNRLLSSRGSSVCSDGPNSEALACSILAVGTLGLAAGVVGAAPLAGIPVVALAVLATVLPEGTTCCVLVGFVTCSSALTEAVIPAKASTVMAAVSHSLPALYIL